MAVTSTTKMLSLVTLVLVMLPGLSLSFTNTNPWRELYERMNAETQDKIPTLGGYVCCNNPATFPPNPYPNGMPSGLLLALTKRDDRDSLYRRAALKARGPAGEGSWAASPQGRGERGQLLSSIISMLRASSASNPAQTPFLRKRGQENERIFSGKRMFGTPGGPNMDWED